LQNIFAILLNSLRFSCNTLSLPHLFKMCTIIHKKIAVLDFEGNAKTRVSLREPEKSLEQRSENLSSPDLHFPTITNSLRRDEPVKTYPGKTASPFAESSIKFTEFMQKLPNVSRKTENISIPPGMTCVYGYWNKALRKWITYRDSSSQEELETQDANSKRRLAKETRKRKKKKMMSRSAWKQKYDVYDRYDETDTEFETGGRDGKRMSFREFYHKQKME